VELESLQHLTTPALFMAAEAEDTAREIQDSCFQAQEETAAEETAGFQAHFSHSLVRMEEAAAVVREVVKTTLLDSSRLRLKAGPVVAVARWPLDT
jgi:hypothetical protein